MGRLQLKPSPHFGEKPSWWSTDEWETPDSFIQALEARYGPFDLDPCCREETAKAEYFYTREENGLIQPWHGLVWVNPPYSQPRCWVEKAIHEAQHEPSCRVIMLLPAAIDTTWFHDLVLPNADLEFIRGRIRFLGWQRTPIGSPTAGSILAFFPKGWK